MQAAFGLPLPERGIGLAAHDSYQAFCAPRVYLTRAERVDGTPTVPARWLRRIDALREGLGLADGLRDAAAKLNARSAAPHAPPEAFPCRPPPPCPHDAARPRPPPVQRIAARTRTPSPLSSPALPHTPSLPPHSS